MSPDDGAEAHFRLTEQQKIALQKLGLTTIRDILFHFPLRYEFISESASISSLEEGQIATVYGQITSIDTGKTFRSKMPKAEGMLEDHTGKVRTIWFRQPYIAKMIPVGSLVRVSGKVGIRNGAISFTNPEIEKVATLPLRGRESLFGENAGSLFAIPVYPETKGITSRWFYHALERIMSAKGHLSVPDPVPEDIRKRYHLPSISSSLVWIHAPKKEADATAARKRFAFDEVFFIQLAVQKQKYEAAQAPALYIDAKRDDITDFLKRFPFFATDVQKKSIEIILKDFESGHPMSRLLEGDVGSGKTAVAATAAYAIATANLNERKSGYLQTAYMAPTEILATQHFESFIQYFRHLNFPIALITGSGCRKFPSKVNPEGWTTISRSQLSRWVANGEIPIVIGTHALIQKNVAFKNLALVIIDEQHRFGIGQRKALVRGQTRTETPTDAEKTADPLLFRDLTYRIREAVFAVRKELGLGHKESIYQNALLEEFGRRKIQFNSQKQIPIFYNKKKVGAYIPDFVIEEKIILELKAIPFIGTKEKKQLWTYLKGSSYTLALLVNFGPTEATISRIVYESRRSALSPHLSAYIPHLLSMTATPIPRTLALTIYGDLDLSLLDEMPHGRRPVITSIVPPGKRNAVYEDIRSELKAGRQAYIICPRIDEPDQDKETALIAKSVQAEAQRLKKKVFSEYKIGILHSKMKPKDKDQRMKDFAEKKIDILVATSVVEVGVNVPNATLIVIEGAERFGLSQLHQLRGRVLRSNHQAFCYLFAESGGKRSVDRLRALLEAKNGFELAEKDLLLRGAGELSGRKQWGISDIGMEAMKNLKMVSAAREEARNIIEADPSLSQYPLLQERVSKTSLNLHLE